MPPPQRDKRMTMRKNLSMLGHLRVRWRSGLDETAEEMFDMKQTEKISLIEREDNGSLDLKNTKQKEYRL